MERQRVLVAEDDPNLRELYSFVLKEGGFEVVEATDGEETLERLASERPSVLVTDIMMPKVSGVEVIERVKREAGLKGVPVIAISAHADYLAKAYQLGAARVMRKPFNPYYLLDAVFYELSKQTEH
jgi:CheY-like chemotaxis protein